MKTTRLLTFFVFATLSNLASASEPIDDPDPVTSEVGVPVSATYVPKGFDSNDNAQIVVSGAYPNSCYKMGPTHVKVDRKTRQVTVDINAYYTQRTYCLMLYIPFTQTVDLGILPAADYDLTINRMSVQKLPIALATRDQSDDYLYSTVHQVIRLDRETFELRGVLPNSCAEISEIRVIEEEGNVLTVLPIVRFSPSCEPKDDPSLLGFSKDFTVSEKLSGPKLLYVRSLNGASINQVFTF